MDMLSYILGMQRGGGGGGGTPELFWATYGETTFDDMWAAIEAGKLPCVRDGYDIFVCSGVGKIGTEGWMYFSAVNTQPQLTTINVSWASGMTTWQKSAKSELLTTSILTSKGDIVAGTGLGFARALAKGNSGELLSVGGMGETGLRWTKSLPIRTTAPSSNNTAGGLILVVLDSEPATYYDGYYYIITEAS